MDRWRSKAIAGLRGRVVEVGFGSGRNVGLYPREVEIVLAVEPSAGARKLASKRIAASKVPVEHIGLDGQSIPLGEESCDCALATFTLCTVPDARQVLAELRRVLKPGGSFHFLEHGLAPDASVARWQRRLDPLQRRIADGCHLTRDPLALLAEAGFDVEWSKQRYVKGPRPWSYFTVGVATKPDGATS
jgi:ubiquinone/menaquinone biosynthesis C-methylase UbiE